jgi:hypothetical protein
LRSFSSASAARFVTGGCPFSTPAIRKAAASLPPRVASAGHIGSGSSGSARARLVSWAPAASLAGMSPTLSITSTGVASGTEGSASSGVSSGTVACRC